MVAVADYIDILATKENLRWKGSLSLRDQSTAKDNQLN
jgi:hypothetical protein